MGACEPKARGFMIEIVSGEVLAEPAPIGRRMATGARWSERAVVNVVVTRIAGTVREACVANEGRAGRVLPGGMTPFTGNVPVFPGQFERCVAMVESRRVGPFLGAVTGIAFDAVKLRFMGAGGAMASDARFVEPQEGRFQSVVFAFETTYLFGEDKFGTMAPPTRRLYVAAHQRKAGGAVIERDRIEANRNEFDAEVFFMAFSTVLPGNLRMEAASGFDPLRQWRMATEAAVVIGAALPQSMAGCAIRDAFEPGMCAGKPARRDQLGLCEAYIYKRGRNQKYRAYEQIIPHASNLQLS
jgi:hypothetical protein